MPKSVNASSLTIAGGGDKNWRLDSRCNCVRWRQPNPRTIMGPINTAYTFPRDSELFSFFWVQQIQSDAPDCSNWKVRDGNALIANGWSHVHAPPRRRFVARRTFSALYGHHSALCVYRSPRGNARHLIRGVRWATLRRH